MAANKHPESDMNSVSLTQTKPLNPKQRKHLLIHILKKVSRSFYLTLRILPARIREPISIAYLLARAADSISDTGLIPNQNRLAYLKSFQKLILQQNPEILTQLKKELQAYPQAAPERELLESLDKVYQLYSELNSNDRHRVATVVHTLTQGMEFDLNYFRENNSLISLHTPDQLDRYTYQVAGCVGEFWTQICCDHYPQLWPKKRQEYIQKGINYGKALQLTNVLRDIPSDLRIGRCYLPSKQLTDHKLNPSELRNEENAEALRPIVEDWMKIAQSQYQDGLDYCVGLPKTFFRLRLATLWPASIGLATLYKLKHHHQLLNPDKPCKIKRIWVYCLLLCSPVIVVSNNMVKLLFWYLSNR